MTVGRPESPGLLAGMTVEQTLIFLVAINSKAMCS
jgi:hypothetical protein